MEDKTILKIVAAVVVIVLGISIITSFWTVVDVGERSVVVGFGQVKETLSEGFHFVNPMYSIHTYNIRNNKYETVANAASSDIQKVTISVAVNYNINENAVAELYTTYSDDYIDKVFTQRVQEAIKSVSAKYQATELVTKREEVKANIKETLLASVPTVISVTDVSITNIEFSPQFDAAIEAKVTAEQNALRAKNELEQTKYEADKRVAQAEGEAKAIEAQAKAIQSSGGKEYVQLKWIEKWSGNLPNYMLNDKAGFLMDLSK